jgi:hypothetical protein
MSTITTTLKATTYDFLDKESKTRKIAKNKILEDALELYKKVKTSKMIKESYKWLVDDKENIELAEIWLEDFNLVYE